jgi:hypothetical protein
MHGDPHAAGAHRRAAPAAAHGHTDEHPEPPADAATPPASARRLRPAPLLQRAALVVAACVLFAPPRAGADVHRAISSPDLVAMVRGWRSEVPRGRREALAETPEMRLTKHLDALKAVVVRTRRELAGDRAAEHSTTTAVPPELHPAKAGGRGPRRKLFDDDYFSTVTPEPSESMWRAPRAPEPAGALRSCSPSYSSAEDASLRAWEHQPHAAARDLEDQHLLMQRRIALGQPPARTCGRHSVVCFDFDRTLSQEHVHRMTEASRTGLTPEEAVAAFGGGRRIQQLSCFLTDLEASGAAIHIVSLGHKEDIIASLTSIGLDGLFPAHRIIGCDEIRHLRLVTKAQCTAYIAAHYGLRGKDVLLVDDDHEQLLECSETLEGTALGRVRAIGSAERGAEGEDGDRDRCGTYWVSSGRGLTACDMAAISGMTRSRNMALCSS